MQKEVQYDAIRDLTIKLNIREGKVNFDKFLYKRTNIATNLLNPKIVITLALKLANNIEASNANPLVASTVTIVGGRTSARRNPTRTILGNQAIEQEANAYINIKQ